MEEKVYKKNEIIFKEGEPSDFMYLIKEGKVKVYREIKGIEKVYAILGPGDILGEMGVLSKTPRSASAIAIEDSILNKIEEREIIDVLRSNEILNSIVQSLIVKIKNMNEILNFLSICHQELRLCTFLGMKFMEEKVSKVKIEEIKYYTDIPEDKLKGFFENLRIQNIIDVKKDYILIKNPITLFEYTKYIFLQEKFKKKEKLKNIFMYPEI